MAGGVPEDQVAVASTGVIGVLLDAGKVDPRASSPRARRAARVRRTATSPRRSARRTRSPRRSTLDVALPSRHRAPDRAGQGRGDDLARASRRCSASCRPTRRWRAETADLLLGVCVKRSFDRISVDGQLSTNDTAILQASGASRRAASSRETEDEVRFGEALDALLRQLALLIVRDGEGAKRIGRVVVRGGHEPTSSTPPRARSPTRRWSRPRCTAGTRTGAGSRRPSAARCPTRRRCRWTSPSRTCRSARRARRVPHDAAGAGRGGRGRGGRVRRRRCPARAPRPRSSSPTSRTST